MPRGSLSLQNAAKKNPTKTSESSNLDNNDGGKHRVYSNISRPTVFTHILWWLLATHRGRNAEANRETDQRKNGSHTTARSQVVPLMLLSQRKWPRHQGAG